ncbi:MAG: hypothetical protein J6S23_08745 [Clostridia bacterium]|nr:hypothetical protein [Clostridia bacterium]
MTQNLLGISSDKYLLKLNKYKIFTILLGILAIGINILFLLLRTNENHNMLLALSIIVTVAFGWIITALVGIIIKPMTQLYQLSMRQTERVLTKIERINTELYRVESFDCFEVYAEGNIFFLVADGNIKLREGDTVTLFIASNIITGVSV